MVGAVLGCRSPAAERPVEVRFAPPASWSGVVVPPPPPQTSDLLDLGERLYGWNCFPCHGADGRGDGPQAARQGLHPRDLTRGFFKLKSSPPGEMPFDEDLYRTITVGIVLGGMPRNEGLDPRDRWALVAYVKSLAAVHFETKAPSRRWTPPPRSAGPDAVRGKELFTSGAQCATCHGLQGRGDGPAAAELRDVWDRPVPVPDLTRGEMGLKGGSDLEDIFRVLTLGMAGTPMPSFESLPARDRWDLAAYVRGLFEPISPGERVYLGAGCTACHTIGRGKLVGPDLLDLLKRRDRTWLRQWLDDPPAMLARDAATRKLFPDYTIVMPKLNLRPDEIESLIDFLERRPHQKNRGDR